MEGLQDCAMSVSCMLQTQFKSDYSDLPAKSEEELDQKIYDLRHDMEHGDSKLSLADEKKRLVLISKLDSQRSKVCIRCSSLSMHIGGLRSQCHSCFASVIHA